MAIENGNFWVDKSGKDVHKDNVPAAEQLKDELVEKLCEEAQEVSNELIVFKRAAFEEVEAYYKLLLEKYNVNAKEKTRKGNITIENFSGTKKVAIQVADRIAFDEKLNIAKTKIDDYLHEITKNSSADIQTLITKAFEVDKKGDVNAKKILALKSYEITHPLWLDAMQIINEATEIISSKSYIRFYTRENRDQEYNLISLDFGALS